MDISEVWKDIEGYEGFYQVSNLGRVKSLERTAKCKAGFRTVPENILKPLPTKNGYLVVGLRKNTHRKNMKIHRLVAQMFIPNPDNRNTVNHIDEDKYNNQVYNLEWCTQMQNVHHGTGLERKIKSRRKAVKGTHLETGEIIKFESTQEAGRNGFSSGSISACARGKQYEHKGYRWEYE